MMIALAIQLIRSGLDMPNPSLSVLLPMSHRLNLAHAVRSHQSPDLPTHHTLHSHVLTLILLGLGCTFVPANLATTTTLLLLSHSNGPPHQGLP